jgi:hypothetical protein
MNTPTPGFVVELYILPGLAKPTSRVLPVGAVWPVLFREACSQIRTQRTVAALKGVVGDALTTNCVLFVMLLITVPAAKAPVPVVTVTGIPARRFDVLDTVTVVPLLEAPPKTGSLSPTRNLINTQAASHQL